MKGNRTLGGILLVSGTAIGAGMLALPVVTGFAGFWPTTALFIVYWLFMTYTALLILEVNLWAPKAGSNMITMAGMTLGNVGKAVSWIAYLFLLYALTTAYLAGGGPLLNDFISGLTGWHFPKALESMPLLVIFGYFIYRGAHTVDAVNRLLMSGLAIAYSLIVFLLAPHVELGLLTHWHPQTLWMGSSIIATSFGFHIVIPSLTSYLDRDVTKLKRVIIFGSAIPLCVYLVWEALVLGIIPVSGPVSITEGYAIGTNGAQLLSNYLEEGALAELIRVFSLIAIVTSFLGVSMSLSDFLADGFKVKRTGLGNLLIFTLAFAPPLLIAMTDPRAFLTALEYAGAFGVIFLLVLMPALMVWVGRKHFSKQSIYKAPGGKLLLVLVIVFAAIVIGIEIFQRAGILHG